MKNSLKLSLSALKENAENVLNKEELISIKGGIYCSGYNAQIVYCYDHNNMLYAEICVNQPSCGDERSLVTACDNAAGYSGGGLYTYHARC
jgi:hypothetical protein